jgi:protein TIF31
VDYRGHRVLCQSIIPGILNQNPQTTALYGSIDDGQTVSTDPAFHELMKGICEKLYIDKSVLIDKSGNKHELWGALDTKGIKGSDQRMYFLEALRLTPRDTNYLGELFSLCLLRPELIEQYQQVMQNKFVEEKMKEAVAGKTPEESKITWEDLQEIIKSYQKVTFNPNVMTSCQFADEDPKRLENIEALSKFVLTNQVPSLAKLLVSEDGCWSKLSNSLSELFHRFGVNLRYIGKVCDLLSQEEHRHIKWTLERYAAVRSSKHIFNKILRETPDLYLAETFASLLNALVPAQPSKPQDNKKKRKRKRGKKDELKDLITMNKPEEQDPENIWKTIQQFTLSHFGVTLPSKFAYWEAVGSAGLLLAFKKDICLALGAQVDQTANLSQRISPNNVLGFVVKTKTLEWRSVESRWLFETGIKSISEQSLDPGMDMLVQSAAIQAQVSGTLNAEVASIYQKISQIYFSQNQNNKAIKFQHSAVCIYEKVLGIDHPVVGNSYINLACYYQTAGKFKRSLRLYSHALQVFMRNFGEMCPEVVVVLVSLGILYGDTGMHEVSIGLLSHVINLCLALYGEKSLFVAEYSHILAAEYKLLKEFPAAQQSERRALEIMKTHFPPDDRRIKESEGFLEELSRQIRDGNLDQTKPKDTKAYLRQRLNARKMKAKLGIPTHQLHMAYPQMDNREEETIRARQLTEQLQRRYQAS